MNKNDIANLLLRVVFIPFLLIPSTYNSCALYKMAPRGTPGRLAKPIVRTLLVVNEEIEYDEIKVTLKTEYGKTFRLRPDSTGTFTCAIFGEVVQSTFIWRGRSLTAIDDVLYPCKRRSEEVNLHCSVVRLRFE